MWLARRPRPLPRSSATITQSGARWSRRRGSSRSREDAGPARDLIRGRTAVLHRRSLGVIALALAWWVSPATAQIVDFGKYPDLKGQWRRVVTPGIPGQQGHDQTKPPGHGQQAPLTPEYEAIFDANLADQANGGLGNISSA